MSYETQYAAYQQGIEGYLAGLFTAGDRKSVV